MRISEDCIVCGACTSYCPVNAIVEDSPVYRIDQDQCVECGVCFKAADCPVDAFFMPPESFEYPRSLRVDFSDPSTSHPSTKGIGRGTEEMKCNDVTARFKHGEAGIAMEFGRPGIATRLGEIEKMTVAMASLGVTFERKNPVYALMADPQTGRFKEEVRNERVLSAILELKAPLQNLPMLLAVIKQVAQKIETVFSLDVITRVTDSGEVPVLDAIQQAGLRARPNAKVNLGMGRPLIP